jgi:hypothetical protein
MERHNRLYSTLITFIFRHLSPRKGLQEVCNILLQLQRLFVQMEGLVKGRGLQSLSCLDVTTSFGWTNADCETQHDAHEFLLMFLSKLDERLGYFEYSERFSDIFKGYCRTTTKSQDSTTVQEESFCCFGITIAGHSTLVQCLRQCVSEETIQGGGTHQVIFSSLPPVLLFHLRRFSAAGVKINSRVEYPQYLNMTPFTCTRTPHFYDLHGVVLHRGKATSGHYLTLVKPTEASVWRKCDGERVSLFTDEIGMLERTFGRSPVDVKRTNTHPQALSRPAPVTDLRDGCECAYLLMYFRRDAIEEVLRGPVVYPRDAVVWRDQLIQSPAAGPVLDFLRVSIYDAEILRGTVGARSLADCEPKFLEVRRESTQHELYVAAARALDYAEDKIRLWMLNSSRVPYVLFRDCNSPLSLSEAQAAFFVAVIPEGETHFNHLDSVLTFVMEFIPSEPPHWIFRKPQQLSRKNPISEFVPLFQEILQTTDSVDISLQNEAGYVIPVQIGKSIDDHKAGPCPVFFIERITECAAKIDFSLRALHNGEFARSYAEVIGCPRPFSAAQYFEMEFCAVTLRFCQLNTDQVFVLRLPLGLPHRRLRVILAKLAEAPPDALVQVFRALRPWVPSIEVWPPNEQEPSTVRDLIALPESPIACFAVFPRQWREGHFPLRVLWSDDALHVGRPRQLQIPDGSTVANVIEKVGGDREYCRVLQTLDGRILNQLEPDKVLRDQQFELRIERVPMEQRDARLIRVIYGRWHGGIFTPFGVPFLFPVRQGEGEMEARNRLQEKLDADLCQGSVQFILFTNGFLNRGPVKFGELWIRAGDDLVLGVGIAEVDPTLLPLRALGSMALRFYN